MTLCAGDRVDRYEVAAFLGSGGMGEVYRARDPKLQRYIALKILRADGALATNGRTQLLREARAVAALSHPNVLAVFDVGEVAEPAHLRGLAYIAMELVAGSALRARIGDAPVPYEQRVAWLEDIARALGAAHDAGLVHRDVKPENVMIRSDGIVKVLDFGVARSIGRLDTLASTDGKSLATLPAASPRSESVPGGTGSGSVSGTPYYMAPEQLRGETIDGRADQFAWGVVAYELLTGAPPWSPAHDPIAVVSQILSRTPPPPAEIDRTIARPLSSAVMRALSKAPAERFATMGDLLASISGTASPQARATAVSGGTAPPRADSGRPSWRAYGLAATVLVAIGGAALGRSAREPLAPPSSPSTTVTAAPLGGCVSSAQCATAHGGGAWRCQSARHECVELASADCRPLAQPSDFTSDETVWLGALYPTTGGEGSTFAAEARALDLARLDFVNALGSSARGPGQTRARPIGVVLCDEGSDPVRAATHLAVDVEAPAVIGFRSARSALTVIPTVLLPRQITSFIAISQAPELTRIPEPADQPRLIWRSTLDANVTAAPLAALVSDVLEPRLRAATGGVRSGPIRVALVRRSGTHDVVDEEFRLLRFNGKSALENGDDFRQYVFEDTPHAGATPRDDPLVPSHPQLVFVAGGGFVSKVLLPLEERWGTGAASSPRPIYLANSGQFGPEVAAFEGKDATRRHRFFGVTNMSTRMPNAQLVLRYNLAFPDEPVTRTIAPQPSYDAFYILAYAALSLGDAPVTGPSLSRALARMLPPGRHVDVGPAGIFDAFAALRAGDHVDLSGALGELDFDPATGEAPVDYAIVCPGVDDRGAAGESVESGLVYDATNKKLTGTMRCP